MILWLLVALVVFAGGTFFAWRTGKPPEAPSWRRPVSELTEPQQQFYATLRRLLEEAEDVRGRDERWPAPREVHLDGFTLRMQGSYVNYSGEQEGLRWLVLYVEPDPRFPEEKGPEDDVHHLVSDGTMLQVTVWTRPLSEPPAERLTAFPAEEGWVERVR